MAETLSFTVNGSTTGGGVKVVYGGNQIREFSVGPQPPLDPRVGDDPIKVAIAKALNGLTFSSGVATGTVTVTAA